MILIDIFQGAMWEKYVDLKSWILFVAQHIHKKIDGNETKVPKILTDEHSNPSPGFKTTVTIWAMTEQQYSTHYVSM